MFKLDIGIGYSIFAEILKPFSIHHKLFDMISQHRIVLSASVVEYYLAQIPSEYEDQFMTYLDSIMADDESSRFFVDDQTIDARQNLINAVATIPMKTLVSFSEEFSNYKLSGIKLITPDNIYSHENNAFNRYTFPIVNHVACVGANCESYSVWLGHLFENEPRITIVDPYIFAENGRKSLEKFYLPQIPAGTEIDVYCEFEKSGFRSESEMISTIRDEYSQWNIHVHLCQSMHDRFILLSSVQISFGSGLIFLNPGGRVTKSCTISVTNDRSIPLPTVVRSIW